jgi:hypothetical protein
MNPSAGTLSQFGSIRLLLIPKYKNFIEMYAFWIRDDPAAYITRAKSGIRRCVPEMLPKGDRKEQLHIQLPKESTLKGTTAINCLS